MLRWFRKTYPSYDLQQRKRQQELEEARAFASPGGAAAPGRREPADGGSALPGPSAALRARRAQGRGTRSGQSCATVDEDASVPRLQSAPALRAGCGLPGAERAAAPGLSLRGGFPNNLERLLALVRPAFDLVLRRIRSLKRCVQA